MSTTPARPAAFYSVLGYDGFRKLWIGQVISNVGDTFTSIAQLILVNQITGSTLALAGMAIALALPRLLFGLIAGLAAWLLSATPAPGPAPAPRRATET